MSIIICERTLTLKELNGKVSYCRNRAFYISPPGPHTGVIIKVCERCKQGILDSPSNFHKVGDKITARYKSKDFKSIQTPAIAKRSTIGGKTVKK